MGALTIRIGFWGIFLRGEESQSGAPKFWGIFYFSHDKETPH